MHLSKPTECTPRINPNANCGLWAIMMCHYRFIHFNKCTSMVGDVGNVGCCACVGARGIWEISVPPAQFCCETKSAPKKKSLKKLYRQKSST